MTTRKLTLGSVAIAAAAASQLGATDCGQITRDPYFNLWCGDQLCAWKVERGTIAEVPTWNAGDPGVQLLGDDTAIEQLTPVTSNDTTCIEFTMIANVDLDAQVELNIDVDDDGVIDRSEQLPSASWKPLKFLIAIAPPYAGVRFELAKTGAGSAVLAELDAVVSTECDPSLAPIVPAPAPLGEPCDGSAACTSGLCAPLVPFASLPGAGGEGSGTCAACDATSCGSGDVCGAGTAVSVVGGVPLECVAAGGKLLGELCAVDAECATGICTFGGCSTCRAGGSSGGGSGGACGDGTTCDPAWQTAFGVYAPWLCGAGDGHAGSGAPCGSGADCASGQCAGATYRECSDGRPCTSDTDCPIDGSTLLSGACEPVGIAGGICD